MASRKQIIKGQPWDFDWSPGKYPREFIDFIDSINSGFDNMIGFEPFEIYKAQAREWLKLHRPYPYGTDKEEQIHYVTDKRDKFKVNTLYYANSVGVYKAAGEEFGYSRFNAYPAQELISFLLDIGSNVSNAKARQIGFTTFMGLAADCRISTLSSFFVKYIAQDDDKTKEIFEDKIKYPLGVMETWARPGMISNNKGEIRTGRKGKEKGEIRGLDSRVLVDSPKRDSINGGSPDLVLVDETGEIEVLIEMLGQGRPTLFYIDDATKKIVMRRQMFTWGTGGNMDKGGGQFEEYFTDIMTAWSRRKFGHGIVPLFLDYMARPGMTEEHYKAEMDVAYSHQGKDREQKIRDFHQAYPKTIEDVFLRNSKTVIPVKTCNNRLDWIHEKREHIKYGYFKPVFDYSVQYPKSYVVPNRIIGAEFVVAEEDDPMTTACMVIDRLPKWKHRMYQGTDPINSETGSSDFSSTIWDDHLKTIACQIRYREPNYKRCYVQAHLMSMYYASEDEEFTPDLIENVIGDDYYNTRIELGTHENYFIGGLDLPDELRGGNKDWGVSNKTNTAAAITSNIIGLANAYNHRILVPWYFEEHKTFVEVKLKTQSQTRETRFQSSDKEKYKDDGIYSSAFAYINAKCHDHLKPALITEIKAAKKKKMRGGLIQGPATNWEIRRPR